MHDDVYIETGHTSEGLIEPVGVGLPDFAGFNATKILVVDDTDKMLLLISKYLKSLFAVWQPIATRSRFS